MTITELRTMIDVAIQLGYPDMEVKMEHSNRDGMDFATKATFKQSKDFDLDHTEVVLLIERDS